MQPHNLLPVHRFVTSHDQSGKAIFHRGVEEELSFQKLPDDVRFGLGYATNQTPVELNNDADVKTYQNYLETLPGLMIPGGTVLRVVDVPPKSTSPMHRTLSLDYGVVLEGSMDLLLDSGETRRLSRGDMAVQRETNHAWINPSPDTWARMLFVLIEANPVLIDGKKLDESSVSVSDSKPSHVQQD